MRSSTSSPSHFDSKIAELERRISNATPAAWRRLSGGQRAVPQSSVVSREDAVLETNGPDEDVASPQRGAESVWDLIRYAQQVEAQSACANDAPSVSERLSLSNPQFGSLDLSVADGLSKGAARNGVVAPDASVFERGCNVARASVMQLKQEARKVSASDEKTPVGGAVATLLDALKEQTARVEELVLENEAVRADAQEAWAELAKAWAELSHRQRTKGADDIALGKRWTTLEVADPVPTVACEGEEGATLGRDCQRLLMEAEQENLVVLEEECRIMQQCAEAEAEASVQKREVEDLRKKLDRRGCESTAVTDELRCQLELVQQQLVETRKRHLLQGENMQVDLNVLCEKHDRLAKEEQSLWRRLVQTQAETENFRRRLACSEEERTSEVMAQGTFREECDLLRRTLADECSLREDLQRQVIEIQRKFDAADGGLAEVRCELRVAQTENVAQSDARRDCELIRLRQQLEYTKETQVEAQSRGRRENDDLQVENARLLCERNSLQSVNESLRKEVDGLRRQLSEESGTSAGLLRENERLGRQLSEDTAAAAGSELLLQSRCQELRRRLEKAEEFQSSGVLEDLRRQTDEAVAMCSARTREADDLRRENEALLRRLQAIEERSCLQMQAAAASAAALAQEDAARAKAEASEFLRAAEAAQSAAQTAALRERACLALGPSLG